MKISHVAAVLAALTSPSLLAQDVRVQVTIENLAPAQGTAQTPVWVGFHDGSFDTFTVGEAASEGLERIAEDGNAGPLSDDFDTMTGGSPQAVLPSPMGPVFPGTKASGSFLLDPSDPANRYFSYASMVLPSNDAFVGNDNPMGYPIFDNAGNFIASNFFDTGADVYDAGTEVNDEIPANTAFFGQMAPNTGVTEGGLIQPHPGFLPAGSGGILDAADFQEGDFRQPGYPVFRLRFHAADAIVENRRHRAELSGMNQVPSVMTDASGRSLIVLQEQGTLLRLFFRFEGLSNVATIKLHEGEPGETGPMLADLTPAGGFPSGNLRHFTTTVDASGLRGPLTAQPLDVLALAMEEGRVYVNITTDDRRGDANTGPGDLASGELRGQIFLTP